MAKQAKGQQRNKPTVAQALHTVSKEDFPGGLEISHVSIRITASGAVPYRLHPADGSEYIGGVAMVPGWQD